MNVPESATEFGLDEELFENELANSLNRPITFKTRTTNRSTLISELDARKSLTNYDLFCIWMLGVGSIIIVNSVFTDLGFFNVNMIKDASY